MNQFIFKVPLQNRVVGEKLRGKEANRKRVPEPQQTLAKEALLQGELKFRAITAYTFHLYGREHIVLKHLPYRQTI